MLSKRLLLSVIAAVCIPVVAQACLLNYSITISASAGAIDLGKIDYIGQAATDDSGFVELKLQSSDKTIGSSDAVLEYLTLTLNADPEVGIAFGTRAGSAVKLVIESDTLMFTESPLVNPSAVASATLTLTDRNNNGASAVGNLPGGKVHQAWYNDSAVYANLVDGFSVDAATKSGVREQIAMGTIAGTVIGIGSKYDFYLSAYDSASGTSSFEVIPEPATLVILGLGAICLIRKK